MINLSDYFNPVSTELLNDLSENSIGSNIRVYTEKNDIVTDNIQIAIFSLNDNRDIEIESNSQYLFEIRKNLYKLYYHTSNIKISDFGDFKIGNQYSDTLVGIKDVIIYLYECNIVPVIIGGSQNSSIAVYNAFEYIKKFVNIVSIDSSIKISENDSKLNSFLTKIIQSGGKYLFNFSNIGFQTYFQSPLSIKILNELYFDFYRLGVFRNNIKEAEPILRDAEIINFSTNSIKKSDFQHSNFPSVTGFNSEEACQIAKYIGLSDKLCVFGILDIINSNINVLDYQLVAHMIWYFIEGFSQKNIELPSEDNSNFKKFIVNINDDYTLIFFKSLRTERWWIEVPYNKIKDRNIFISCSYEDYLLACKHEIPDKWLHSYQKIN